MKTVLLATNNHGKSERFRNLIKGTGIDVEILIPSDLGLEEVDVIEDGDTLRDNAEIKARAYFRKVDMPIIANDTGFWIDGEGLIDAPKRIVLNGEDESKFTKEEIAEKLINFWKQKATDNGGQVDAAWVEAFVLVNPDGTTESLESRREVILTNQEFGEAHIQMPVRALYISKITNKPAIQHTEEEELEEMQPVIDVLKELLK